MKKLLLALLIIVLVSVVLISILGIGRGYITSYAQVLYDENGTPVQLWIGGNGILDMNGLIYEVEKGEDGVYYVDANTTFKRSDKLPLPNGTTFVASGTLHFSDLSMFFDPKSGKGIDFLPADTGENAYSGKRIANLYYLDKNAESIVMIVTDMINGEIVSTMLKPIKSNDGQQYFILSNGNGEYTSVPLNLENPDEMIADISEQSLLADVEILSVSEINYDSENNPVSAVAVDFWLSQHIASDVSPKEVKGQLGDITNKSSGEIFIKILTYTFNVLVDTSGEAYLEIPTVNGEYIYAGFDLEKVGANNADFADVIIIPKDVIAEQK